MSTILLVEDNPHIYLAFLDGNQHTEPVQGSNHLFCRPISILAVDG